MRLSSLNTDSSTARVTCRHCSSEWSPSMTTSGSTIGTRPASWHSPA